MEDNDTVIFSKPGCSGCDQAKKLLDSRKMEYKELILDIGQQKDPNKNYVSRDFLLEKVPNARTVPQIFLKGRYIGGFAELVAAVK